MSSDKWNSEWGAVKAKWASIKPKLNTAWAIICDVIIELYKPIAKFALWVYCFASKTPIRIAASAILTCVILIMICSLFIYPVLFSSTLSFNRFGQISLGITGLFTLGVVIWRGILHAHEEKIQAAQLRETENNNIAKLLVDGTKLLGKDMTEAEKMAGIACLANIIEGQSKFDKQAVEILQRFIVSFDDKALHGEGFTRISEIIDYKLFLGDKPAFDNVFAALCALERYGELKKELVHLNCSIAIKGEHPSAHYKWLNTITWYKTNFNRVELIDKAIYIKCHFINCILSGDAIFAHGNIFDEVFFNTFAIDDKQDDSFWFSKCYDEDGLKAYTANKFGMINYYNDKKITKKYKRAFLEHFKVEASDLETFEKKRSYLV